MHRQVLSTHSSPLLHAGPPPQPHTPALQVAGLVHVVHAAPLAPQAALVLPGRHVLPEQQPPAHDDALHTQPLPVHLRPAPHAALPLQPQVPFARQVLEVLVLQSVHAAPFTPQAPLLGVVHTLPTQQPLGHDVESHTHWPLPSQRCPLPQAAPLPHRHWPPAHWLAFAGSHAEHAPPPAPHWLALGALTQVEPAQQPLAQVLALQPVHAWPTQVCPLHVAHAAPPVPHAVFDVPV